MTNERDKRKGKSQPKELTGLEMEEAQKKAIEFLRQRFEALTDITLGNDPYACKEYAEWLETLDIQRLNFEIERSNDILRRKMREAMDILEAGITKS